MKNTNANINTLTLKEIKTNAKVYSKLKNNDAPAGEYFFAFSKEQFDKGLAEIRKTTDAEVFSGAGGMIGTKKGFEKFKSHYDNVDKQIKEQCHPLAVFYYEYYNHESDYSFYDDTALKITQEYFPDFNLADYAKIVKQIRKQWCNKYA